MLKLTMDYKMTKHMLNSCTLKESRTWLLDCTRHCYFIPFNHEHPVFFQADDLNTIPKNCMRPEPTTMFTRRGAVVDPPVAMVTHQAAPAVTVTEQATGHRCGSLVSPPAVITRLDKSRSVSA